MSEKWCEKHRPAHTGRCADHEEQILHEMHDDSLACRFKISAIFYCPVFTCTFYDYNYDFENDLVADADESKWEDAVILRVLLHKLALREGDGE